MHTSIYGLSFIEVTDNVPPKAKLVLARDISVPTVRSAATSPAPLYIRAHVAVPVLITEPVSVGCNST